MKTMHALLFLFALMVLPLSGQETAEQPDYSRENLQRFVATIPEAPEHDRGMRFYLGAVEFRAIGTRWRMNYLPIMAPFSGTRNITSREIPDPFALTGTVIATPRRAWYTQRQLNAELRRIERSERARTRAAIRVGNQ